MIISRSHANKLVREGKAIKDGAVYQGRSRYQVVLRTDVDRIDHYKLELGQMATIQVTHYQPLRRSTK